MRLFVACLALFLLFVPQARATSGTRVIPAENYELELASDLHLSFDGEFLHVQSPLAEALVPAPYGSSRKGWANFIDYAAVTPSGYVGIHYRSNCDNKLLLQPTSLSTLRAKLLVARAEQHPNEARALIEQAQALAPAEPTAAVARAAADLAEPARAARLLAPALSTARFDTYFEILRRAPPLRDLPLVQNLRARRAGGARLDADGGVLAISGSLLALSVGPETEADCSSFEELLLLDAKTGDVLFRRPTVLRDDECRETHVNTGELNQLLSDFGFNTLRPAPAHLQTATWGGDSVRWTQRLPTLHAIIVATNRDSDVCEGLPSLEVAAQVSLREVDGVRRKRR